MKTLFLTLAGYLAATSALAGVLLGGVLWLISTDGAESQAARVASVPPRIADSIERKKAFVPQQAPPAASVPARPLQETNVALRQPPAAKWVIRELAPPRGKKRETRPGDRATARASNDAATAAPSGGAVHTRSDNFSGL